MSRVLGLNPSWAHRLFFTPSDYSISELYTFFTGGHDGSSYLNSVERYDPKTNEWSSNVAPTSSCRTSVGVGVLEGCIYAVGGQDGVSCLNIVER